MVYYSSVIQARIITFVLALSLFCGIAAGQDEKTTKAYPMLSPDPDIVIQAIKELVGEDAKIFYHKGVGQLIITATPIQHSQITGLLDEINKPGPNVRIDVDFKGAGKQTDSAFGLNAKGDMVVTPHGTGYSVNFKPQVRNRTTESLSSTRQTLVVSSGKAASLFIGQEAPYAKWLYEFGRMQGYIEQDFETVKVGSLLSIEPTVIGTGPLINVKLTPEISMLANKKYQRVKFTRLTTEVVVKDGETITIGGLGQNKEFSSKFLVGGDKSGNIESLNITLTPHIQTPGGVSVR